MKVQNILNRIGAALLIAAGAGLLCVLPAQKAGENPGAFWKVEQPGDPVLRVHVVGHSNSPADQEFKLMLAAQLRSLVAAERLPGAGVKFYEFLRERLPRLERQLNLYAAAAAPPGAKISVQLVREQFPLRAYGRRIYPPGEYHALKVLIGEGGGDNWWCLLFPPLCLPLAEAEVAVLPGNEEGGAASEMEEAEPAGAAGGQQPRWRSKVWEWFTGLFGNN